MSGNPPVTGGAGDAAFVSDSDTGVKGRGRTRYCKKCKFTCTDAREFTAHQSTHSESGDSKQDSGTTEPPSQGSTPASTRRVLRPKRNSKSSVSDTNTSTPAAMEPVKDNPEDTSPGEGVKDRGSDSPPLIIDTGDIRKDDTEPASEAGVKSQTQISEAFEEPMDEEDGDEPDAMTTTPQNNISKLRTKDGDDTSKLPNGVIDNFSGDEDMDEEGQLVIDEDSLAKPPMRSGNIQNHTFACHKCDVTTSSAKSYLYHLRDVHCTDNTIYDCDLCDYATINKQKLSRHRKGHFSAGEGGNDSLSSSFNSAEKSSTEKLEDQDNFLHDPYPQSSKQNTMMVDDEEEDIDRTDTPSMERMSSSMPLTITTDNIDQVLDEDKKKKKKTRQEVDPGKYFEAVDGSGTKYACSQCGNIYKWRKSLNKHWKEKHSLDPLVEVASPPGMLELLKSGKYTQLGARRIYDNAFLATIKTNKNDDGHHATPSPSTLTQSPSPPNFLTNPQSLTVAGGASRLSTVASMMPKMIGPFVANTAQPVFPGMPMALPHLSLPNGYDSPDEGALDLTHGKPDSRNSPYSVMSNQDFNSSFDQDQPLDFSKKKEDNKPLGQIKPEKLWEEMSSMKPAHTMNQYIPKIHRCSKCDFTSTSEVDFANHTSSHLNKRIVRCNECKLQINSMDELNNHFNKFHFQKLTDYKEAIKKIPHGLQQTYHLLKMDLQDIGDLGNQDLGASDTKSLKCKKCDFEAKWPAELQKHAVSHSEERPYVCMVCGSTYKWKWDLVKHFQKSHPNLPNPYRRNDKRDTPDGSSEEDMDEEPEQKRPKLAQSNDFVNGSLYNRDDNISVEGIIAATQAGQRLVSSQPNILDDEPNLERNLAYLNSFPFAANGEASQAQVAQMAQAAQAAQEILDRRNKAQRALQDAVRNRQNGSVKKSSATATCTSGSSSGSKTEELPYKCTMCNYHARWPSEVTQHMKNHSDSKPYLCPRCEYRSKWKWDVVKHLKRCGGGGINDVIDTTKSKKKETAISNGPPNAIVSQRGKIKTTTPQPPLTYIVSSVDENGQPSAMVVRPSGSHTSATSSGDDMSRPGSSASTTLDFSSGSNNNNSDAMDNNFNNNYASYNNGIPLVSLSPHLPTVSSSSFSSLATMNMTKSPAPSPGPSPAPQVSSGRQNTSGEIWNCPHCPFTTQSQAELKRHSGLHSDDKPFKCDVCQYSTRWACDLKKHRRSYNHFPKTASMKEVKEKTEKPQGRFKCQQCIIYFQSLQSLLEHRLAEHIGRDINQDSPNPQTEHNEIDQARIKHPRKPIKQIQCPKCPFVCKSRQTMDRHMEEHEQLEMNGLRCAFCSSQFKDKEALLDHITTHSSFNPKEWETFFMINEEEEQQHYKEDATSTANSNDNAELQMTSENNKMDTDQSRSKSEEKGGEKEKIADTTEARIQQILSNVPKQKSTSQPGSSTNKFKCEWCPAEFVNLTAVYKHASQAHPIQLKEQDVSMGSQPSPTKSALASQAGEKKYYKGEPIDILRQQIAEKRNQQLMEKFNELISYNEKSEDDKGGKRYACDKCDFSSANLQTFQRHFELHGSKMTSQCWFCDYRVDRMNLLYQHMKISHTRKWKALSQDPKYASQIQKINLAFGSISGNNNDSPPENSVADAGAMDLSSKTKGPEVAHEIMYVTKQQYTWSGIPVNVVPVGNALNFVCPHCAFNDASIAKTCAHVMQSHRAMNKFTCKMCWFSTENIHVMSDHCKTHHPVTERIVEVLDFKPLNFSELQMVQLNAMRERATQQSSKSQTSAHDEKVLAAKAMTCPFCPFKTLVTEHMKAHVSDHSKQSRYRCQTCDFSSDSTTVISDHVKVHETDYTLDSRSLPEIKAVKKETVEPTESKFSDKNQESHEHVLGEQESSKSKPNKRIRYRCSVCPYYTTCRSNVEKHKRQHNNNKKYKCPRCSYGAARAVLLKNHLDSHDTPVPDDGQYHDLFVDPNSPGEHLKTEEADDRESEGTEMEVDDIDEDDANSDDLDEMDAKAIADLEAKDILEAEAAHKASILLDEEASGDTDNVDKQFRKQKCPHCPFSSNSGFEFRKHLNFHGTQERYKCDLCSYSLDRLNLLTQHRKLHADEPGYDPNPPASNLLNTSFILQQSNAEMNIHDVSEAATVEEEKTEAADGQFSCPYCPYKVSKKKPFEIHCNSHHLRKRYICDFCDWSADRLGLLYQHRKVHENETDYDASPEDKVFLNQEFDDGASGEFEAKFMEIKNVDKQPKAGETEASLSPPFKLTVVKKSYPCTLCPYKTNSKSSYSFHKSMHESGAEYSCTECSYAAVNRGLLQQHMHLHANGGISTPSPSPSTVRSPIFGQPSTELEKSNTNTLNQQGSLSQSDGKMEQQNSNQSEALAGSELKCQRCPFTTIFQKVFEEHMKGHTSQFKCSCPFCDFTAEAKDDIVSHSEVHFTPNNLQADALKLVLEKHLNAKNNNADSPSSNSVPPKPEVVKTKRVYVCQFCEREFEAKDQLIQHEKQHPQGSL